jgi:Xaa-Pro aminopeptidase
MFEAVAEYGSQCSAKGTPFAELELAATAEHVSREAGFAGHIRMRKWPMDCDRAVVASGPSGALPTFFDSAVGAAGSHPLASLGAGHRKIQRNEPVIVDIVHVHRGYVSDMTRMFSLGAVHDIWHERQTDMVEVAKIVRNSLGRGSDCSAAWSAGVDAATQMGHADYLMGMAPDQAKFLGHSIGLELDETPVVAAGFNRPLPIGATMAIEPKVIQIEGAVGIEDSWVRTTTGMERLSGATDAGMAASGVDGGEPFPDWTEW